MTVFFAASFLCAATLDIRADKLVYLDKGSTAVFRKHVVFSKEGFSGRAEYLKLDKKTRNIRASGKVYSVFKSTSSKWAELRTKKLNYSEPSDRLSSDRETKFIVHVSTAPGLEAVYNIVCASFYGFVAGQNFYLSGKPVKITGNGISGSADSAVYSGGVINMRGNASVVYRKENPYEASADFISMDIETGRVSFRKSVKGVFYAGKATGK